MFQLGSLWIQCATKSRRWIMSLGRSTARIIISSNFKRGRVPWKIGIKFNLIKGTKNPHRDNLRLRVSIRCRIRRAIFRRYPKLSWRMLSTKWIWGQLVKSIASKSYTEFNKLKVDNNRITTMVAEVSRHRGPKFSKKITKMITIWRGLRYQSIKAAKEEVYHTFLLKEVISPLRLNPIISRKGHHRFQLMKTYWRKILLITWRPM